MTQHTIEISAADYAWAAGNPRPRSRWRSLLVVCGVMSLALLWSGGCQRLHWLVWFSGDDLSHAQALSVLEMPQSGTDRIRTAISTLDVEHADSIEAMSAAFTRLDAPGIVSRDALRNQAERCIVKLRELGQRQDEVGKGARAILTTLEQLFH